MKLFDKIFSFIGLLLVLCFLPGQKIFACTMCTTAKGDVVLAGNNEDWKNYKTYMWFETAAPDQYGRVFFGFDDFHPQGGMNDQGLCFDGFATPRLDVKNSANLPYYGGNFLDGILAKCATVEEVVAFCNRYNLQGLENAQLMFADKTGASAIIEGDEIIYKENVFQVCTNFYHSNPSLGGWPCPRYDTASEMLTNTADHSVELIRNILDATHQEGFYPTQYSNIYDLTHGTSYLYYLHNFQEVIIFDLQEELQKGPKQYHIPSLFSNMQPLSPQDGEILSSTTVEFLWEGKTANYQLFYSTDPNFSETTRLAPSEAFSGMVSGLGFLLFSIYLFGNFQRKRLKVIVLGIPVILFLLFYACGDSNATAPEEPLNKISRTVEDLQPNTVYYWKVAAQSHPGFTSETTVRTFRTGE